MTPRPGARHVRWLLALVLLARPAAGSGPSPKPVEKPGGASTPNKAKGQGRDAEPIVRSKAAIEAASPRRPATGASRYDPEPPGWDQVPPWRQTSFFGVRAEGRFFLYVVDCSGSMLEDGRLIRAKQELRRSVAKLQPPQRFQVIFYNDQAVPMPGDLPKDAGLTSRNELDQWLRLIEPDGETDPGPAMSQAIALRPDAIFLLSDGDFPDGSVEAIARKNTRKVPIHCIDLAGGAAGDGLQRVARASGGRYVSRPVSGFGDER